MQDQATRDPSWHTPQDIWWSGPAYGLGNRLLAVASALACTRDEIIHFPWLINPPCPGRYQDVLAPHARLVCTDSRQEDWPAVDTSPWDPSLIYPAFCQARTTTLPPDAFWTGFVHAVRSLPFHDHLIAAATGWRVAQASPYLVGVHIRRTDRINHVKLGLVRFERSWHSKDNELPPLQTALYTRATPETVARVENTAIWAMIALRRIFRKGLKVAVFADDTVQRDAFIAAGRRFGFRPSDFADPPANAAARSRPRVGKRRETGLSDAALEILCLSKCDAIVQNNRASSFSLVAAIVGAKPILSGTTRYTFWHDCVAATGRAPNDPNL